jgi:hypothetical protein
MSNAENVMASKRMSLYEVLDRLLGTGAVADGKILLSVADVDLIYLGLRMVLASVATLEEQAARSPTEPMKLHVSPWEDSPPSPSAIAPSHPASGAAERSPRTTEAQPVGRRSTETHARPQQPSGQPRMEIQPENVERGLAKLVLTIVELLRRLMESQALRRVDQGTLSKEQVERLGKAFSLLEARMEDLKKVFGLEDEELNLDLGPLGELM